MARYRREVEAILYTGDNVEEIKEFLGENFIRVEKDEEGENGKIWFKPVVNFTFKEYLTPLADMIVKYSDGIFGGVYEDDFLAEWEEVE